MAKGNEVVDKELLGSLYQGRGQALELLNADEAVRDNYEEMRTIAEQRQDQNLKLASLISQSALHDQYTSLFNPAKARELAQEALALARELGDEAAEAGALSGLMTVEITTAGDNNLGMSYGRQALALARTLGLKELVGRTLNLICWPLFAMRQNEQAREALSEAQSIWRELGNLQRLAEASRFLLIIHNAIVDHRRILAEAPQLAKLGAAIGSRFDEAQGRTYLALTHARQGRFALALNHAEKVGILSAAIGHDMEEHIHQFLRISVYLEARARAEADRWADSLYDQRETMLPAVIHSNLAHVALAKIANGELNEGRSILDELLSSLPADTAGSFAIVLIAIAYAHLHLAQGKPEALFAGLEKRVWPYREAGFRSFLADEYWLRGRAEMALGHCDAVRETLLKAKEMAEAQEERAVLWQILVSLADVEEACGNRDSAAGLLDQAREVVDFIAEHAGELRELFLALPEIQAVLTRRPKYQ